MLIQYGDPDEIGRVMNSWEEQKDSIVTFLLTLGAVNQHSVLAYNRTVIIPVAEIIGCGRNIGFVVQIQVEFLLVDHLLSADEIG